jgi:hypothetical protein
MEAPCPESCQKLIKGQEFEMDRFGLFIAPSGESFRSRLDPGDRI